MSQSWITLNSRSPADRSLAEFSRREEVKEEGGEKAGELDEEVRKLEEALKVGEREVFGEEG